MSTLTFQVVGAAVGWIVGGPTGAGYGFSIGTALGSDFNAPPDVHGLGPRLEDLRVQGGNLGDGKIMFKGSSIRAAGIVVWATPYVEHATVSGGGGKGGGGGSTVTSFSYTVSMAVALGEGPIIGVRKIWANSKLIYDVGDNASNAEIIASNAALTWATVYNGSETQTQNSFIKAYEDVVFNKYYYTPAPLAVPAMRIRVGPGSLTVSAVSIRNLPQTSDLIVAPVTNPRIDRVVLNKTNGVASILTGTEAVSPVAPAVPLGFYSICSIPLTVGMTAITTLIEDRPRSWAPDVVTVAGAYVHRLNKLYKAIIGGTTGAAPVTGTAAVFRDAKLLAEQRNINLTEWQPLTSYLTTSGSDPVRVVHVANRTGIYKCVTAGVSGTTGPTGVGNSIADGTVIWDYIKPAPGVTWAYVEGYNAVDAMPTPAYLGTAYVVFYDYSLSDSGNTTPNFEFEVVEGTTDLGEIVTWVAGLAGLPPAKIDVTQLAGKQVTGLSITNRSTGRAMIQPLASAYFFDAVESSGVIRFVLRGAVPVATIPLDSLAAHSVGEAVPDALVITRIQELELPRTITVRYPDKQNALQIGVKYSRMQGTQSLGEVTVDLPLATTGAEAQNIADKLLNIAWNERTSFAFTTGREYNYLEPTDSIVVASADRVYAIRILSKEEDVQGRLVFQGIMEDRGLYVTVLNDLHNRTPTPSTFNQPPGSVVPPHLINAPGILTVGGFELWIAVGSAGSVWGGCGVFVSTDNVNFTQIGAVRSGATYGTAAVALGTDPDTVNTLNASVQISGKQLYSVTQVEADNKQSLCYLDGELLSYKTATLVSTGEYALTYLRRGVYNTPIRANSGGTFALLNSSLFKYAYSASEVGQTRYFKFPSFNKHGAAGEDINVIETYSQVLGGSISYPSNVTGFTASQNSNVVVFQWNLVPEPLNYISGYEFRYAKIGLRVWANAIPITKVTKGTQITTGKIPPGDWALMACAVDISGNASKTPAYYDMTVRNANIIIHSHEESPAWTGTLVNMIRHWTGVIQPDSQNLASADGWSTFDIFVINPYPVCSFEHPAVDVGFDFNNRVWGSVAGRIPVTSTGAVDASLFVDFRTDAGSYAGFIPWTIGNVFARFIKMKVEVLTAAGVPCLTSYIPTVDAIEVTQSAVGVTVAAGGSIIVYPTRFNLIPVVSVNPTDAGALIGTAVSITTTQFTAHVYNTAGTSVGGIMNWSALGV